MVPGIFAQLIIAALLLWALPTSADQPLFHDAAAYNSFAMGTAPNQTFHSTNITAPVFLVNAFEPALMQGSDYLFLTGTYGAKSGPMIFSSEDLSLVYADLRYSVSFDARVQSVPGNVYFTYVADGACHVLDKAYREEFTVMARDKGNTISEVRACQLTDHGTAVVSMFRKIPFDLTPMGGSTEGQLRDAVFQEVELSMGKVVFEWRASEHFDLAETFVKPNEGDQAQGFDWFHISGISKTRDGDYLVSSRNLCMVVLVDHTSGNASWVLGGKRNEFQDISDGNAVNFGYQNDAQYVLGNESRIALFDNHGTATGSCQQPHCSRAMQVELDYKQKTVRLMEELLNPHNVASGAGGSVQRLPNLDVLVAWGSNPTITQYLPNGTLIMDVQRGPLPKQDDSNVGLDTTIGPVRKMSWVGMPSPTPKIGFSAGAGAGNKTIYLSWNGATEIDTWRVFAGHDVSNVTNVNTPVGQSRRNGFETAIILQSDGQIPQFARAAVLDAHGNVLAATDVLDMKTGRLTAVSNPIDIVPMSAVSQQSGTSLPDEQTAHNVSSNISSDNDAEKEDRGSSQGLSFGSVTTLLVLQILYHAI